MPALRTVKSTSMDEATAEEMRLIVDQATVVLHDQLVGNLLSLLETLRDDQLGYRVDRYEHSLQTATRALRDGARVDLVVAALLHDVGEGLAPANHDALAGAILEPYLDEEAGFVVRHHGVFQGFHYFHKIGLDRDARERFRDSPHFEAAAHFCAAWDQRSFDPGYDSLPLEAFLPMVHEVFDRPPRRP